MLYELSSMNGESMSSIVSGLVAASSPVIKRLILTGKEFQRATAERQADVLRLMEDAEERIYPHAMDLQHEFLSIMDQAATAAGAQADAADPRRVTRGSRPPLPTSTPPGTGDPA